MCTSFQIRAGSPPRVRGKGHCFLHLDFQKGTTPARAGKRRISIAATGSLKDHPRACGEKLTYILYLSDFVGSPPRVRGKVEDQSATADITGITPARAGKRWSKSGREEQYGDHPRACGEKWAIGALGLADEGSPPRVRGKACKRAATPRRAGITPARAGKSSPA